MKTPNWIYLDLEAQKSAEEAGGWHHIDRMKCAVAVAYVLRENRLRIFTDDALPELASLLRSASCVIGYNLLKFDLVILQGYQGVNLDGVRCLVLLGEFTRDQGHRVSLDDLTEGTFGARRGTDGPTLIKWWRAGKKLAVAEECCNDVLSMHRLHQHALEHGWVRFRNKFGRKQRVEANWTTRRAVRWTGAAK